MHFQEELEKINSSLINNSVEFIVIGGFAVNYHGYSRATNDLDIWLKPTTDNFLNFVCALEQMQYDVAQLKSVVFNPKKTFIRVPFDNLSIEFLTDIPGNIPFTEAFRHSEVIILGQSRVRIIGYEHLIQNKKATNRPKDVLDVVELEKRRKN